MEPDVWEPEQPCEVCLQFVDDCKCPKCPRCGSVGDPHCNIPTSQQPENQTMKTLEKEAIQAIRDGRARFYRASLAAIQIISRYDRPVAERLRDDLASVIRRTQIAFPRA